MESRETNSDETRNEVRDGLREPEMFEPMTDYLERNGYEIVERNEGRSSGADIRAVEDGRELVMEMKGRTANLTTDIRTCIGQICGQMEASGDEYGVALSESYRPYIDEYGYALQTLGVQVFVVSPDGVEPWQWDG